MFERVSFSVRLSCANLWLNNAIYAGHFKILYCNRSMQCCKLMRENKNENKEQILFCFLVWAAL